MCAICLSLSHTRTHTHSLSLFLFLSLFPTTHSGNSGQIRVRAIQRVQLPVAALVIHPSSTRTHTHSLPLSLTTRSNNSGDIGVCVVQHDTSLALSLTHAHTHTHTLSLSPSRHPQAIAGIFVRVLFNVYNFLLPHWSFICLLHVHTHSFSLSCDTLRQ